jgi:tRNA G37 N-methylase Trm5
MTNQDSPPKSADFIGLALENIGERQCLHCHTTNSNEDLHTIVLCNFVSMMGRVVWMR